VLSTQNNVVDTIASCNNVRSADFTVGSLGRLVGISAGVQAFVPDPLPIELSLDHLAVRLLADAEHAIGRLAATTGSQARRPSPAG
jgi:hypothetical protein